ncbi:MAG: OmpA family protein [Alphaproteobacteria bacterium]|nr:OmpA family protein [Alphaproteobacteria bacterium]
MGRWIVLAGVVAIATIGYYATVYPSDGLGRRNVYAITATLQKKADDALGNVGATWASVHVEGQVAVLSGEAPTDSDRQDAIDAVRTAEWSGGKWIGGITAVRNSTTLAKPVSPYEWTAQLGERGFVLLSGDVPGQRHRRAIKAEAQRLFPKGVDDQMVIAQGAPTGPWTDTAIWALAQLSRLTSGEARFKDRVVLIRGAAPSETVQADIEDAATTKVDRPYKGQTDIRLAGAFDTPPATEAAPPQPAAAPPAPATAPSTAPSTPALTTTPAAQPTASPATTGAAAPGAGTAALAPAEGTPSPEHDNGVDCQKMIDKLMTNNTIAFASGSFEVRSVAHEMLDHLAASAAKCPLRVRITGHIDTTPADAADPNLSQERADAVASYLMRRGVSRKRITSIGAGAEQPVGDNATLAGQAKNRRIEITVTN